GTARDRRQRSGRDDDGRGTPRPRPPGAHPVPQRRALDRRGGAPAGGRRQRRRADRGRPRRGRSLQRRQPGLPPVARRLAARRGGPARRGGAHRGGPGHHVQPLRLRPPDGTDDAGGAAGRHRPQGPGADPDVAGGAGRARVRPGAGDRGACGGLRGTAGPRRPLAPGPPAVDDPQGPARLGDRGPGRQAQLGLPPRCRRHPGHPGHRRAGPRSRLARAEHRAPLAAGGAGGRRHRDGRPAGAGERHPVAGAACRGRRRPGDAGGRGHPAPVGPGLHHRRVRDDADLRPRGHALGGGRPRHGLGRAGDRL
ncbi:MAG: Nucleoside-diphosphate-sugar epimerases, partial [uncultured Blastococcus sp.]